MAEGVSLDMIVNAIGVLIGYFGSGIASEDIFSRLLFPTRFYNMTTNSDFLSLTFLLPLGGPVHKAALQTLDRFVSNGLFSGYCRGDMLGSAFFDDRQQKYYLIDPATDAEDLKNGRNVIWYRALEILSMHLTQTQSRTAASNPRSKDGPASERGIRLRSVKPFLHLRLEYIEENAAGLSPKSQNKRPPPRKRLSSVSSDLGTVTWRTVLSVICTELVTIIVGLCMACIWKTPFSLWFGGPLISKIVALLSCVRRQGLDLDQEGLNEEVKVDVIMAQFEDLSKGALLLEGPRGLVMQFFHHYGHPERSRQGISGDRKREVISMGSIVACMMIFPIGLLAFQFAPSEVRLLWICYQLYATLAMFVYRISGGGFIATTEKRLAEKLRRGRAVRFEDGQGASIIVHARIDSAQNAAELQATIEERKKEFKRKQTESEDSK